VRAQVRVLIEEARKRQDCQSGANADAVSRLVAFVDAFEQLRPFEISSPQAWHEWVCRYAGKDWMEKQHFDDLLSNFGFERTTADELQRIEMIDNGKTVSLQHHSLRWLGKAFAGYNVVGCLTDVANLIFAMNGPPPSRDTKPSEQEIVDVLDGVVTKLCAEDFTQLWVPTHMMNDAEVDDNLAWLLLEHVHRLRRTRLRVLVQLPRKDDKVPWLESVVDRIQRRNGDVFHDEDARNIDAIQLAFQPVVGPHPEKI